MITGLMGSKNKTYIVYSDAGSKFGRYINIAND